MSLLTILRLPRIGENIIIPIQYTIQTKNYAVDKRKTQTKGAQSKGAQSKGVQAKVEIPVEKDINKLLNYVCGSNIYTEGEDIKLKPDSEYPEWLWSIKTEPPKLSDFDPDTKQYWRFVRKQALKRKALIIKNSRRRFW